MSSSVQPPPPAEPRAAGGGPTPNEKPNPHLTEETHKVKAHKSNRERFRDDFREETGGYEWHPWRWFLGAIAVILATYFAALFIGAVTLPFRTAHGVTKKVTNPDNVIFQYEKFHDNCNSVRALDQQYSEAVKDADAYAREIKGQDDPLGQKAGEVARLRSVAQGIRNQRISVAEQYNADSRKLTQSPFKSHSLPYRIDPNQTPSCEASQ